MGTLRRKIALVTTATAALMVAAPSAHALTAAQQLPITTTTPVATGATTLPAPTADIGAVANALVYTTKSVTKQVTAPAGIATSSPVYISVSGSLPQAYSPKTGYRYVISDTTVTDPTPRRVDTPITVQQSTPAGPESMTIAWSPFVKPLYTVQFGPATFTEMRCWTAGDPNIILFWQTPDARYHGVQFDIGRGHSRKISKFASTWKDVAADSHLQYPRMWFSEWAPGGLAGIVNAFDPSTYLPGVGQDDASNPILPLANYLGKSYAGGGYINSDNNSCTAQFHYQKTDTLETFSSL